MTIELLHSNLDKSDALGLLTNILYTTINYHEHKIIESKNYKDIRFRKSIIIESQKKLYELKQQIDRENEKITFHNIIKIKLKS
jgi:hypothetical protein